MKYNNAHIIVLIFVFASILGSLFIFAAVGTASAHSDHGEELPEEHDTTPDTSTGRGTRSPAAWVWPVSGTTTSDLPQSSAYGPRLRASQGFVYDYHQGIDMPIPAGTTLYAVTTGTVRIAGSHPSYQDGVVQLDHGDGLYSNYLHISASLVTTGQLVTIGEPVALSGIGSSGFHHLHFEIRDGSLFRRETINPWRYLPYNDTVSHTIAITDVEVGNGGVWVRSIYPKLELDVDKFTISVYGGPDMELLDTAELDYEGRNLAHLGDPAVLDNPDLDNILISPHKFNTSSDAYVVDIYFYDLHLTEPMTVTVQACALDVKGNAVCDMVQYLNLAPTAIHLKTFIAQSDQPAAWLPSLMVLLGIALILGRRYAYSRSQETQLM